MTFTKRFLYFLLLIAALCGAGSETLAAREEFPRPAGLVNDFARMIPPEDKTRVENLCREILEKTGTAVVVATVPSLGENELNDYVNRLYRSWGIGKKGENKGVLLFIALKERKIRIETGYGVEGILPDGRVGEIRDRDIVPYLRRGEFGKGVFNGVSALGAVIAKDANVTLTGRPLERAAAPRAPLEEDSRLLGLSLWTWVILGIVVVVVLFSAFTGEYNVLLWLLYFFLSSGRGGGSGGSGGGFDSFGGGGFDGFGGGDSGGGGASGDF